MKISTKKHILKLTEEQIDTIDYAILQLQNNISKDFPNDAEVRRSLKKKYETISWTINFFLKTSIDRQRSLSEGKKEQTNGN